MTTLTRTSALQEGMRSEKRFKGNYKRLNDLTADNKVSLHKPWSNVSPQAVFPEIPQSLRLRDFLNEVVRAGEISKGTASWAWETWLRLSREMGGHLTVPDAAPGNHGELLLTWDQDDLHLELEFLPDGPAEFFSRNRTTGALWGEDYRPDAPLSAAARERLGKFL